MVIVVVRHQHQVDARQVGRGDARRHMAPGTDEGQRGCAFREDWIGQQRDATQLCHGRGVANPGDRGCHARSGQCVGPQEIQFGCDLRRGRLRRRWQAVARGLAFPAQHLAQAPGREVAIAVAETVRAMVGLVGIVVAVHDDLRKRIAAFLADQVFRFGSALSPPTERCAVGAAAASARPGVSATPR